MNKQVLSFDDFINEMETFVNNYNNELFDLKNGQIAIIEALDAINYLGISHTGFYKQLISTKLYEGLFNNNINFVDSLLLNEGIADNLKKMGQSIKAGAQKYIKDISHEIKGLGKDIKKIVNWLIEKIKKGIAKVKDIYKTGIEKLKKGATAKIQEKMDKGEDNFTEENLKSLGIKETKGVLQITKGFVKMIKQCIELLTKKSQGSELVTDSIDNLLYLSIADYIKEERMVAIHNIKNFKINKSMRVDEGEIPIFTKLKEIIEKLPPFIFVAKIEHWLGHMGNETLTNIDKFLKEKQYGTLGLEYKVLGIVLVTAISYLLEWLHLNPVVLALETLLGLIQASFISASFKIVFGCILTVMIIETFIPEAEELAKEALQLVE